jgi:hypothetical protein
MKYTVHAETLTALREALASGCTSVRFGPEFCEWKIPSQQHLQQACEEAEEAGKDFAYVVPILSNPGVEKIVEQLDFLGELGDVEVVVGDLGALNLLQGHEGLKPRLGRPRVYIPARSPWSQITRMPDPGFFARRRVEKLFYQTSLNYVRSLEYYRGLGVMGADVDWIPKCFPSYQKIARNGLKLAVHSHAIPVAVTMRCHMARFLGEEEPALCSKPCLSKAFKIKQKELEKTFTLNGNVVYRQVEPTQRETNQLRRMGVDELVIPMGPVSNLTTKEELDEALSTLSGGV